MERDREEGLMRTHAIRRVTSIVLGALLLVGLGLAPGVATASGGGGCGRAVTYDGGTRVNIRNFCFGPTILLVRPGETVTWVNRDGFPHTVLGANASWGGYDNVRGSGGEVSYRFVNAGTYPYVCTYHPGMLGAVVVGDGKVDAATQSVTTDAGPVTRADSPVAGSGAAMEQDVVPTKASPGSSPAAVWWLMGVVLVIWAFRLARGRRVTTS
jgi:plastocyanin